MSPAAGTSGFEDRLRRNVAEICERISRAAERSGRRREAITLVCVTKYARWEWVRVLATLQTGPLGESRPQQLLSRAETLRSETGITDAEWHLIGHLQRNKVRPLLGVASLIHSVDSLRLLQRIESLSLETGLPAAVLLEVNVSGEAAKDGFSVAELKDAWPAVMQLRSVQVNGLMTMAPLTGEEAELRRTFGGLRELRDELASPELPLAELSMGMSNDFEIAIEEGATLVRIGSLLYEGLEEPG